MKKQLLTMLAVCAASCAWAAEVYSANTIGYTRVAVNSGLNLLGSQFVEVGTDAAAGINDIVIASADLPGMDLDSFEFQTFLMTWTGAGYTSYYLIGAGQGELLGDASLDGKWVDGSYQLVDVTIPAGSGFWVQTTGAGTVTFAK